MRQPHGAFAIHIGAADGIACTHAGSNIGEQAAFNVGEVKL
jgi:hypothetical protein